MAGNPFRALGLDAGPGLSDDEVRAAWHRVAAATHPDRADGGDPAAFSAAAAAYSDLRTPFGRGEALADLAGRPGGRPRGPPGPQAARPTPAASRAGPESRAARR
jgi:curved DNA-binding protein CbpA